jgi:DNA (cytosine-5)-methyltransferase 1
MRIRPPVIRAYLGSEDVIVDSFAGGGGVSEAFRRALGRSPDHAINHDPEALTMHAANHPETAHHCGDIWGYKPRDLVGDRRVAAAWFSPDCKDHSSAKGGKPVDKKIRALAWTAVRWAKAVRPGIIFLENVPEFMDWGPCILVDGEWKRDPKRKGQTFRKFIRRLQTFYKYVEFRLLRADDYGAPTKRKRFYLMASNRPLVWPTPTHGPLLKSPRTAAECIDFTNLGASIFMTREEARAYKAATGIQIRRPLKEPSLQRIAAGIDRYVLKEPQPFLVPRPFLIPVSYSPKSETERPRVNSVDEPIPTITSHGRGRHALISPILYQSGQGEREGQRPRYLNINEPLGTVVACGQRHAMASALLAPFIANNTSVRDTGGWNIGARADEPMPTVTAQRQKAIVAAHLIKLAGTSPAHLRSCASSMRDAVPTITAGGWKVAQVAAFLVRYNGQSVGQGVREPCSTLDTNDRLGLVSVVVDGELYVIADILMRMLEPRELFNAQGFGRDYIIDPIYEGEPLTRTAQVRMCGNAVAPHPAEALIGAQFPTMARAA